MKQTLSLLFFLSLLACKTPVSLPSSKYDKLLGEGDAIAPGHCLIIADFKDKIEKKDNNCELPYCYVLLKVVEIRGVGAGFYKPFFEGDLIKVNIGQASQEKKNSSVSKNISNFKAGQRFKADIGSILVPSDTANYTLNSYLSL